MAEVLLSCQQIKKSMQGRVLFEGLSMGIFEGDRIGLIGPNGAGKSTLLKILAGLETPDDGSRSLRRDTRMSYVPQVSRFPEDMSIEDILKEAVQSLPLDELQKQVNVQIALSRAGFRDPSQKASHLSGGWKKRLDIARSLATEPDLLLLDEPTNHLDVEGILWLEELLRQGGFAFLVITHDRFFLERATTAVMELNAIYEGGLFRSDGNYERFLIQRDEYLQALASQEQSLSSKVRRETEWLQRGPKARTTKARARIQEAERLIQELSNVRERQSANQRNAQIALDDTGRKTKELLVAKGVGKSMGGRKLFSGLNLQLRPGMRLGLIGTNGSGKTTLLKLLAGELEPDEGTIQRADQLQILRFEQDRASLDLQQTLQEALASENDRVIYQGKPMHVVSWARRFLFRDEQLGIKVGLLSGGEQARIQLARLMLQPADILLMDEPTNDLDIPTLELLEESLLEFQGALVLITHDRYILDNVTDVVLSFEEDGSNGYFAGYTQWESHRKSQKRVQKQTTSTPASPPPKKKKSTLTYMEQKEFEQMEEKIMMAEEHLEACHERLQDPKVASDPVKIQESYKEMETAQKEVERLYARWGELEAKANGED
ncbi:MAG: ABC-F family ATP-binding cassette domain-containing protein [Myxococcales bacterium]|nr:ABC-F family ATP-binding cassette domain-containing protein [Myxococcales bacterium]MCB9642553.1 ABC-F family ATP-binding cassette domain-containing protein [Myxococcales bacterium]